jgi:hypothetical protein
MSLSTAVLVHRAKLEAAGWVFTELADGWIAELDRSRGAFGATLPELVARIRSNNPTQNPRKESSNV